MDTLEMIVIKKKVIEKACQVPCFMNNHFSIGKLQLTLLEICYSFVFVIHLF